ncbi:MAG: hypothetical protein GY791_16860 [Alphaproteobacteria bacterium]|nr:hypothetical protein [Alphaproteobacteria bacterium]
MGATENERTEPIEENLVMIELELGAINFRYMNGTVVMNGEFALIGSNEHTEVFEPWEKRGNLNLLWPLVNVFSPRIVMNAVRLRLFFDSGHVVECKNANRFPEQVNIWGFESPEFKKMHPDGTALTRYPGDF